MATRWRISVRGALALALGSLLLAACAGHGGAVSQPSVTTPSSSTGVLAGTAQACAGLAHVATADLQVYRGDTVVAEQRVPDGGPYRFVLHPGRYFITNTGTPQQGLGQTVSVSAGHATHFDVPDNCM